MDWETFWSLHAAYTALIEDADKKREAATDTLDKIEQLARAQAFTTARQILFQKRESLQAAKP